jgi:hypothetical protein
MIPSFGYFEDRGAAGDTIAYIASIKTTPVRTDLL